MIKLGLIGYPLGHSFSKTYYLSKFDKEKIQNIDYDLYPIATIEEFKRLYQHNYDFRGVNVTIPYKVSILPYLDELSEEARAIGAVNCVTIDRSNSSTPLLKGYNTDAYGFEHSLRPLLKSFHKKALVLGNGGAAKAVVYTLQKLGIPFLLVSRTRTNGDITYEELTKDIIHDHQVIINCSPVGTFPNINECPAIPYDAIGEQHILYDLIYNPEETLFLKKGKDAGAVIKNGYEMLVLQAEENWSIWKSNF